MSKTRVRLKLPACIWLGRLPTANFHSTLEGSPLVGQHNMIDKLYSSKNT